MHFPGFSRFHLLCVACGLVTSFVVRLSSKSLGGQEQFSEGTPTTHEGGKNPKRLIQQTGTENTSKALTGLEQLTQQFRAQGDLGNKGEASMALGDAYANQGDEFASLAAYRDQQALFEVLMTR